MVAIGLTFIVVSVTWADQYNGSGELIEPGILLQAVRWY